MSEPSILSRSVRGLTVLVTGAASGMGRATAEVFASEGANVAATDVTEAAVRPVVDMLKGRGLSAEGWGLDVADPEAIENVTEAVAASVSAASTS